MNVSNGVKRVLLKLDNSINNGNYYEAHQMYRTLYFRYLGQQNFSDLIRLLHNGSLLLLQRKQYTSGADLGMLYIDVLKKSKEKPSFSYFENIIDLFSLMDSTSPERETFVNNALRWSNIGTNYRIGHPKLHQRFAEIYWKEKNYLYARQHFLYSSNGDKCATMMVEFYEEQGYTNEIDLFITQIVLQYLCLDDKISAMEAFDFYIKKHPKIEGTIPFMLPLLNFSFLLLELTKNGTLSSFTILCEQYFTSLTRDPSFLHYLEKIGKQYFNTSSSHNSDRGLFSSFLQSLFDGIEEDKALEKNELSTDLMVDLD
ncbi:Golgi to ER traffic protein 4 homolog isoform X1 [Phymastichus coffea]|uniref:Golgi to ER traffic protein 4 homolog isoform X1 n=1 Tax=Phymastichus coffea TaxID=108790 RepID=UPI00273B5E7C|nr:Golgi to ER traffic protein 4 homolog isoform X1 [Phymastichus coffea]